MKKVIALFSASFLFALSFTNLYAQEPKVEVSTPERVEVVQPKEKTSPVYYPIPYVPVLTELGYKPDKSAIFKSGKVLTGMLVFSGNIKSSALVEFYRTQMRLQGWEEVGAFSSKINFLSFRRPEGTAFVIISEGMISTELRIVVMLQGVS
jgi:hypothetical protein